MSTTDTRTLRKKQQTDISAGPKESVEPSPLLEQAQAWADIAREAHDECAKGDQAEHLLHLRRNTSGQ